MENVFELTFFQPFSVLSALRRLMVRLFLRVAFCSLWYRPVTEEDDARRFIAVAFLIGWFHFSRGPLLGTRRSMYKRSVLCAFLSKRVSEKICYILYSRPANRNGFSGAQKIDRNRQTTGNGRTLDAKSDLFFHVLRPFAMDDDFDWLHLLTKIHTCNVFNTISICSIATSTF